MSSYYSSNYYYKINDRHILDNHVGSHIWFGKSVSCASAIYLPSLLALEFSIIVDKSLGASWHGKYVAGGLNYRYKHMFELAMTKLLNPKFTQYEPKFSKFVQVLENEEYQSVSSSKEAKRVLLSLHTRDTKNNKQQENEKFSTVIITFKT